MSDIETRVFRYFVAVAEEQYFARAAMRLGITPSTLTRQIEKLESRLGTKLLERSGSKLVVTKPGRRFLADAREVLRKNEKAVAIARQAASGELGRLQLGFTTSVSGADLLAGWFGPFQEAHPAIEIDMRRLAPMAQITAIMREELDAGLMRAPCKYPSGVRGFEIYRQRLALALPSKHPLAQHEAISPAVLAGEAFVSTTAEPDLDFFGYTEVIARIGNFTPRVVKRDEDFMMVLMYVALGHGIAVAPQMLKAMDVADVVFRDIAADPIPQMSIAFVHGSEPSPSAKLLIRHMRRYANGTGAAPPVWTPKPKSVPKLVFSREA
jgi:DNA-binding transcriptional LysR family regulator